MIRTIDECFWGIQNGANIKQSKSSGGFPITRIETIADNKFNRDRVGYAGITDVSSYESYILEDEDLLMSHINSAKYLGRTVLYNRRANEVIIHGMNLLRLRANKEIINPSYAKYLFSGCKFKKQVSRITKKSVNQASFTVGDLKKIKISVPSILEQVQIVEKLDKIAWIIELRQAEIKKAEEIIKARFVELFGDPVSNSYGQQELMLSELGELGRGVSKYRPRNEPKLLGGEYPLVQTGDVANAGLYVTSYSSTYSELGLKQSKMWSKGTLCITIAANIAKTSILNFDACFPDSIVGFKANNKTNNIFIHYWFLFFQEILESQAPESAQKSINLKILNELRVIVPPIEMQNEFADFVRQADKSKLQEYQYIVINYRGA